VIDKEVRSRWFGGLAAVLPHRRTPTCRSTVESRAGVSGAGPDATRPLGRFESLEHETADHDMERIPE
jgi:hypothetical protein